MPKFYLPLKDEPTKRETILYIPGADSMDISQLREIIHWQQEKFAGESKDKGPKPIARFSRQEVGKALKEYRKWLRAKREDPGHKLVY